MLGAVFGSTALAENLSEVYRAALGHDAVYAAAQAAYAAAQEKLPQARAGLLPNASLSANARRNDAEIKTPSVPTSEQDYTSRTWGVSAAQPIYRGQNWVAYDQAKVSIQLAENQFKAAGQDLVLRAARAYFDVLLAQDTLDFIRAQKAAIAEQLAAAKRNFEVGTATITDTHEAQARYDLATAQEIASQNDLEVKRRALHTLTGRPIDQLAPLAGAPKLASPAPQNMEDWVSRSQTDNLQVLVRQYARQIADKEIERARAGHHPTLDLTANYTDTDNQSFLTPSTDSKVTVVGLEFALPLYQGGLTSSQVREAVANREKARQELEDALRNAALQTRQAYLNVTSTEAQVRALEAALVSSEKSLESTQLGLQVGVRTNVDVLNAQQQVFSAKKDLAAARYNFLLSVLNLKAAAGSLSVSDLQEIDQLLVGAPAVPATPAKTSLSPASRGMSYALSPRGNRGSAIEAAAPAMPPSDGLPMQLRIELVLASLS
jgi:outer membrane protein